MFQIDLKTMIAAAALSLTIGGGVLTIKLDIQQLKLDVASVKNDVLKLGCVTKIAQECGYSTAANGKR